MISRLTPTPAATTGTPQWYFSLSCNVAGTGTWGISTTWSCAAVPGQYDDVNINANTVTLDRDPTATSNGSSGTWFVGGALYALNATLETFLNNLVAGNKVWLKAGTYTLTASADSLTSAVSSSFTISAGNSAAKLVFTTQPDGGLAGTTWPTRPAVTVQDAYGNTYTASGFYVALALTTPGGATLRCTPQYNTILATGVGTFAGCKADKVGTYTLTATSSGLTSAISSSFTITAAAAAKLAFTTQPSGGAGGVGVRPARIEGQL